MMVLVRTINIGGEARQIFTGTPLNQRWPPIELGLDFKHSTLKSLFINGIGHVIAQNDGIGENNQYRRGGKADFHWNPPKSKMATN